MSEDKNEQMGEETPESNEKNEVSESAENTDGLSAADGEINEPTEPHRKRPKKVSLFAFLLTTVSLVLAAVMVTYTLSSAFYRQKLADVQLGEAVEETDGLEEYGYPFWLFSQFVDKYTFEDTDRDAMMAAALKSYIAATGDRYAYYYTAEEFSEYQKANAGQTEGIGINIIYSTAMINGESCSVIKVINVMDKSPAQTAGLRVGDLIYGVGIGEEMKTVDSLGYDMALSALKGAAGTEAEFTVIRPMGDGYEPKPIEYKVTRVAVTSESVYSHMHVTDKSVGVVKILQFDLTTPTDFTKAMDELIAAGCTKFIFDVRYNPGGDLKSIQAVLSYFLSEGDVTIRTLYKDGKENIDKVEPVSYDGDYAACSVSAEDIGKYRREGFEFAVLCNGSTASAAELFTATFRDYSIGTVVGETTYGKGCMQSIISLWSYGLGALKLTVAKYFSGGNGGYNDGYDGVGIEPDVPCKLSEAAASKNIYELADEEDDQMIKAVEALNN